MGGGYLFQNFLPAEASITACHRMAEGALYFFVQKIGSAYGVSVVTTGSGVEKTGASATAAAAVAGDGLAASVRAPQASSAPALCFCVFAAQTTYVTSPLLTLSRCLTQVAMRMFSSV